MEYEKKDTYTAEEVALIVQRTSDQRVNQALDKKKEEFNTILEEARKEEREKVKSEIEERAKLSAEELAKKEFDEKVKALSEKESSLAKKSNNLTAREMLTGANIPKEKYEALMGMLVTNDEASTKENVENFIKMYSDTKSEIETSIRSELSKVNSPKTSMSDGEITKDKFMKMGYAEKLELKMKNPELFSTFMK